LSIGSRTAALAPRLVRRGVDRSFLCQGDLAGPTPLFPPATAGHIRMARSMAHASSSSDGADGASAASLNSASGGASMNFDSMYRRTLFGSIGVVSARARSPCGVRRQEVVRAVKWIVSAPRTSRLVRSSRGSGADRSSRVRSRFPLAAVVCPATARSSVKASSASYPSLLATTLAQRVKNGGRFTRISDTAAHLPIVLGSGTPDGLRMGSLSAHA